VDTDAAHELADLVARLYPICRSITGDGVRDTLAVLAEHVPLVMHEVPSGTSVLDWTVPPEWNITDAFVADAAGRRVIDFRASNLHVVNYSTPIDAMFTLDELRPHLFTLPEQPDLIPYRTTYYDRAWGFCLSQHQLDGLDPGEYHARIDSTLEPGHLTYGELLVPGRSDDEILVSSHVCHPSLADDNLSGVAVATLLARDLIDGPPLDHSVRFLFAPGTIGAITWLAGHGDVVPRIRHGLTLQCLGDAHPFTYKRTVAGDTTIDRAAGQALRDLDVDHQVIDFFPYGYDERQYNSPGYRLAVGALMRGRHGKFPEYHTSADNLSFVAGTRMAESLSVVRSIIEIVDRNRTVTNLEPYGEPQLGRRGLYRAVGGSSLPDLQMAMLWVLNLADGRHDLLDIASRAQLSFTAVAAAAELLEDHGLLASERAAVPVARPSLG
jgi:aminopeptidase-like protein